TRFSRDWSSDVCSSDLGLTYRPVVGQRQGGLPPLVCPAGASRATAESARDLLPAALALQLLGHEVVAAGRDQLLDVAVHDGVEEIGRASWREVVEASGG